MKQTLLYISLLSSLLLFDGCVPKVCPAYISSFYQKDDTSSLYYVKTTPDTVNDYFVPFGDTTYTVRGKVSYISYFLDRDSVEAKEEELFASRERGWNGIVEPRGRFYDKILNSEKKKAHSNYPNYIIGLQHNPYPLELTAEDSVINFIPEDSIYLVSASDSLENMLFAGGPGYDDSMVAKELPDQKSDEANEETNDSLPPMMYDGYVYMQKYGDRVAKEDSMRAGYFLVPDSMYLVERKWFELWKPKYYMIPKSVLDGKDANKMAKYETDSLSQLPQYDSLGNEIVVEKKGLFGKKKKKEETAEEGDLTDDSTGSSDVSSVDDDETEEGGEEQEKEKKGLFGKKKKDKKKKEEEVQPADDEDW
ncbi:hypothetical protein [Flammeovirga sp. SJP92]|uniref:hypothetical protein n=1 Tax=Flammeovirga sp. SJP92 TaxID=1775430 RepID=UPI000788A94A|nr:hypothetical protein [Flammeovirga sp. SJP92]KXX71629.1 hypothetical protein AVL50_04980 [Flammeovirga sp. SJP92]